VTRAWGERDPNADLAFSPHPPTVEDGLTVVNGELPGTIRAVSDEPTTISFSPASGAVSSAIYVGGHPPWWYDLGGTHHGPCAVVTVGGSTLAQAADGTLVTPDCLCPDLLRHGQLGEADGWRGRVVRAFFFVLRAWPVRS
jgi:hypothetical protein